MNIVRKRKSNERGIPKWKTACPVHSGTTMDNGRRITVPFRTLEVAITAYGTRERCWVCKEHDTFTLYCEQGRENDAREHYRETHIQVSESCVLFNDRAVTQMFFRKMVRHDANK